MKEYYVISLKWTRADNICFWRPDNAGYTEYLDEAGIYTEEQINGAKTYYCNAIDTVAVEKEQIAGLFTAHTICKRNSLSLDLLKAVNKTLLQ